MKPIHEQEWKQGRFDAWRILDESDGKATRAIVTTDNQDPSDADAVARFIAASPDMARALLAQGAFSAEDGAVWHMHECWNTKRAMCLPSCSDAVSALRDAGILP